MKVCSKCLQEKNYTEFYKQTASKDGYNAYCKECTKKYHRDYYQDETTGFKEKCKQNNIARREQRLEDKRLYELEHADEIAEEKRLHDLEQKERNLESQRRYYWRNREAFSARHKIYSKEHSAELVQRAKEWREAHPEQFKETQRQYRERKKQVSKTDE